jgi:hypothetical protein
MRSKRCSALTNVERRTHINYMCKTNSTKLETEGKTQQVAGKIQNAVGGFKDAVKEAVDD